MPRFSGPKVFLRLRFSRCSCFRCFVFGRRLGLQQTRESELVVFLLVFLAVCIGTELPPAGPSFEKGQLLTAVQTPHVNSNRPFFPHAKGHSYGFLCGKALM